MGDDATDRSVESVLRTRGILAGGEAVALREGVERAVHTATEAADLTSAIRDCFEEIDPTARVERRDGELFVLDGDSVVAHWHSEAAVLADIGIARVLDDRLPRWREWDRRRRAQALGVVRTALSTCPDCGGSIRVRSEPTSPADGSPVRSIICVDCGAPLVVG